MSKGLGRGLSSLFAIYEEEPKKEQPIKKVEKMEEKPEKLTKKDDILNHADDLLSKYQNKKTETEQTNRVFEEQKLVLEQKLSKANEEMYQNSIIAKQVPINKIQPNPDQPRKTFDQEALKDLAQSIKEHGIIQPIIAVYNGENYIIIAGERRYRASKIAGLKTMPVIVKDYTEQQKKEIALIENLQREDLNPIETAVAIKQLIDNYGFTQDEVAIKIGKSRPVITNTLRLLNLEPEVVTLIEKGKLSPAIGKVIVTLPRDQQISLAKKSCDGKMTSKEVEEAVHNLLKPDSVQIKKAIPMSAELLSLREDMQQVFGTKVTVLGNDKKGRIYLDYYNRDDLDRIYSLLQKLK